MTVHYRIRTTEKNPLPFGLLEAPICGNVGATDTNLTDTESEVTCWECESIL